MTPPVPAGRRERPVTPLSPRTSGAPCPSVTPPPHPPAVGSALSLCDAPAASPGRRQRAARAGLAGRRAAGVCRPEPVLGGRHGGADEQLLQRRRRHVRLRAQHQRLRLEQNPLPVGGLVVSEAILSEEEGVGLVL